MLKKKNIIISDVTLRDGNHAVNHSINEKVIRNYCEVINETGVNIVEVGHGNGLGASSLSIGRSRISDEKALKIARSALKKTKLSIHSIPGFSRLDDLKKAIDCGVDIFRIGTNSTEIDTTFSQIEFCKKNKVEFWGVLMMAHLVYDKQKTYLEKVKFLHNLGVKTIVIMDSAGIFLPDDIKDIILNIKKRFKIKVGFHGHNNLGNAIWNSISAYLNGAEIVDVSIKGFGAGAGNAQMDIFLTVLEKIGHTTNIRLDKIYKIAKKFPQILKKEKINYSNPFSEPKNIMSANYGLFSGFASKVDYFSDKFKLDDIKAFKAIGNKRLVAGQEDLIFNILYNLKKKKN
jgi:4-hydroxy 2-oxovalerate aldolase